MTDHTNPDYYKAGDIETIDFIKAKELGFLAGNVVKYISRYQFKGDPRGDLLKAKWYLDRLVAEEPEHDRP